MMKIKIFSVGFILILLQISVSCDECVPDAKKCECVFSDGTGFKLDEIVNGDGFLKAVTNQGLTFFYHPCGDTKVVPINNSSAENQCKKDGYSLCVQKDTIIDVNTTKTEWIVLGKNSDLKFVTTSEHSIDLVFGEHKSSISLQCTPRETTSYLYAPLEAINITEAHLTLFSDAGCSKEIIEGHGHFFYFILFLFIAAFLYLAIGMTVNYIFVGARGYELIPNYDFWCKAWTTMKLGFAYVKNGCRVIPTEDSYDAI